MDEPDREIWKKIDLRHLQLVELEILLEFDRICRTHGLRYTLFAGTLVGAVVYGGFVPWDDDVDVCMPRADYTKFLGIAGDELGPEFFLQTTGTDRLYHQSFAKLRKHRTRVVQDTTEESPIHHGIWIDILPLDRVLPGTLSLKLQLAGLSLLRKLAIFRVAALARMRPNPLKRWIAMTYCHLSFLVPKRWTDAWETRLSMLNEKRKTGYVSHITGGSARNCDRFLMKESQYLDTIELKFEGHAFPVPRTYHNLLTQAYGNYLAPPPLSEQHQRHRIQSAYVREERT